MSKFRVNVNVSVNRSEYERVSLFRQKKISAGLFFLPNEFSAESFSLKNISAADLFGRTHFRLKKVLVEHFFYGKIFV